VTAKGYKEIEFGAGTTPKHLVLNTSANGGSNCDKGLGEGPLTPMAYSCPAYPCCDIVVTSSLRKALRPEVVALSDDSSSSYHNRYWLSKPQYILIQEVIHQWSRFRQRCADIDANVTEVRDMRNSSRGKVLTDLVRSFC
jgi:hypothetical protein